MSDKMFKPVDPNINFSELEEKIISFWKENRTFEKSVEKEAPNGDWNFLDGPPFITGMPHYGTLLASLPKDMYPRYYTMKGYRVRRVWGWDCHGLPAENKVENKLGLKSKKEIEEKIGVKKFIDECKLYVSEVSSEWEWYVDHVGRWVDFKNAYRTMDLPYMESVMWVFKQLFEKKLIYKGLRVSLYCPHCSTPISNFEVAMDADNYKDVTEPSNVYKYKVVGEDNTFFLAWSTTPWTKVSTTALAVNSELEYVKVKQNDEYYILAKSTIKMLKDEDPYEIVEEMKGADLVGKLFERHYDHYKVDENKKSFVIISGDFVTAEEGTGIVTIAPYGEEDLNVMNKENIFVYTNVDDTGVFTDDNPLFSGMYYSKANAVINNDLTERGLMYREDSITHSVANCWRCQTRLIYAPQNAWYVNVQSLKAEMKKSNESVNWYPEHFKHGRFEKSLDAAPDWCISRSRYWGSPVPVWECECGELYVPGSINELEEMSGQKITDLHKPEIDEVTIKCTKCGKTARRVPEVLDSWTEAGSASFAERHYPFADVQGKPLDVKDFFPPDFIVEYTGQIRAWFYVLQVIATALKLRDDETENKLARNVLVTGVILGTDGRKMSKNYGNYPDPKEMLQKYGGDALRLYLLGSKLMDGEDIRVSEEEYKDQVKGTLRFLWNVYNFFITFANTAKWSCELTPPNVREKLTIIDKWILSRLTKVTQEVSSAIEGYDSPKSIRVLREFIADDLSGWYIRRCRDRVGASADTEDQKVFLSVLYGVLTVLSKVMAPITPFITEEIFKNLTGEESVHLQDYPKGDESLLNNQLISDMTMVRKIVEKGHAARKVAQIAVRQPLGSAKVQAPSAKVSEDLLQLVKDELNVKEVVWTVTEKETDLSVELDLVLTPELVEEGQARELARTIQEKRKELKTALDAKINVVSPWIPNNPELVEWVKNRTLVVELVQGNELQVKIIN